VLPRRSVERDHDREPAGSARDRPRVPQQRGARDLPHDHDLRVPVHGQHARFVPGGERGDEQGMRARLRLVRARGRCAVWPDEETERWRRRMRMSRSQFVRTSAAMAIGFWAIDMIRPGIFGSYGALAHNTPTTAACDLEWVGHKGLETLKNLPGEFIFDVQS